MIYTLANLWYRKVYSKGVRKLHSPLDFKHQNPLLEEYLTNSASRHWGNVTGRSLKPTSQAAARAAASEFADTAGMPYHRDVFRSRLEGAGVHREVANHIAVNTPVLLEEATTTTEAA